MPAPLPTTGTVAIDEAGCVVALSPEAAALTGADHDAAPGLPFADLLDADDRETAGLVLRRVRAGEIDETRLRVLSASQEPIWIALARDPAEPSRVVGRLHTDRRARGPESEAAQADRLRLLATVTAQGGIPFAEKLEQALRLTTQLLGYDIGIFSRIDGDTYTVVACHAPEANLAAGATFALGQTYCALMLASGDLFEIDHMAASPHRRHPCYEAFGLESYVGAPVFVDEEVYGTLNFSSSIPRAHALTDADDDLVRLLALWLGGGVERAEQNRALRERKRRLLALSEATFEGIFFSERGLVLDCNEQGARLLGVSSRQACIGLTIADLVPEESFPKVRQMILDNRPEAYEVVLMRQDGQRFWAEVQGRPTPYDGRTVRLTAIRDITRRREAQEQTRFQADVLAHVSEAVVAMDLDGRVTYWNAAAEALHGLDADAVLGRPLDEVVSYEPASSPEDTPRRASGAEPLAPREALRLSSERADDLIYITPSGERRVISVSANMLRSAEGAEVGMLAVVRDVTTHRKLEDKLWEQAHHDALTGLPNRVRFRQLLGSALESGDPFSLFFVDLDRFKTINDSLGHDAGDRLLETVSAAMQQAVHPGIVARLGGDEFAVLAPEARHETVQGAPSEASEPSQPLAEALIRAAETPVQIGTHTVTTGASVGVVAEAHRYTDPDALLRDADTAMYEAKRQGRGRATAFIPEMHTAAAARFELERDLRRAIAGDELRLHYQPIVDLATGALAGFEALVRWQDPARGLRPPIDFLPLAEELGLVAEIDRWVLEETCREIGSWGDSGNAFLTMSVNCSDQTFLAGDLATRAREAAERNGIDPARLVLELTERVLVESGAASGALERLRQQGLKLSIDDFGSGYSSLGLLHRLPVDALKIDRSFVSDLETSSAARAIVRAVSDLAGEIGLRVTAEGIETEAQLRCVMDAGCPYGQGYLFARPVAPEAARAMLRHRPWHALWGAGDRPGSES